MSISLPADKLEHVVWDHLLKSREATREFYEKYRAERPDEETAPEDVFNAWVRELEESGQPYPISFGASLYRREPGEKVFRYQGPISMLDWAWKIDKRMKGSNCQMLWMTACSGGVGLLHPIGKPDPGDHLG